MTGDTKVEPVDEVLAPVQMGGASSSGDSGDAEVPVDPDSAEFDELCARNPVGGGSASSSPDVVGVGGGAERSSRWIPTNTQGVLGPGSEVRLKDLVANPDLNGA